MGGKAIKLTMMGLKCKHLCYRMQYSSSFIITDILTVQILSFKGNTLEATLRILTTILIALTLEENSLLNYFSNKA